MTLKEVRKKLADSFRQGRAISKQMDLLTAHIDSKYPKKITDKKMMKDWVRERFSFMQTSQEHTELSGRLIKIIKNRISLYKQLEKFERIK